MMTTAKLRAYTGITAIYIFLEDYEKAYAWGKETERLFNNVHFVTNHPLYGAGDSTHADSYYGRAMNLTFLASASLAVNQDKAESEALFQKANSFYNALGYSVGLVTTAALKARIYNRLGMYDKCYFAGEKAKQMAIEKGLPDYVWQPFSMAICLAFSPAKRGRNRYSNPGFQRVYGGSIVKSWL